MRTDYATLSRTAQTLKRHRDEKQKQYQEACQDDNPVAALTAKAEAIRADKKYQQAIRVAIGGIKRIARRGPDHPNHKQRQSH